MVKPTGHFKGASGTLTVTEHGVRVSSGNPLVTQDTFAGKGTLTYAALKKCKKKFPKGPQRNKCINRAQKPPV